ncbi:hypothetical protein VE02_07336 [Pseudogymnoascus sp. 03VT05]|nr:hypothetical protein VE02_07336 [Pseudogymnoascus sp. 03VT05]
MYSSVETKSQNTLIDMSTITDPFWAELLSGINTGLLQQFAPRVNSTATWEENSAAVLPDDCNEASDAFYLRYEYDDVFQYSVEICLPGNMSQSPWRNQNSRQDITEELYLKMNFSGNYDYSGWISHQGAQPGTYSNKLTLRTTTGYFELPNYMNGQVPGPLLDELPSASSLPSLRARDLDNNTEWTTLNATGNIRNVANKGRLLNIAMALFGEGSFVDIQRTSLAAYATSGILYGGCISLVPFISLLKSSFQDIFAEDFNPCLSDFYLSDARNPDKSQDNDLTLHALVASYFYLVTDNVRPKRVPNAFSSADFLATDVFMTNNIHSQNISVQYAMGADISIPHISRAGIIFVSALLAIDLACLLGLALYSASIPRWTGTLDSLAMMRIGASIADTTPLKAARHVKRVKALDGRPGWVVDGAGGEVGELCLGGGRALRGGRRYECYDSEVVAEATGRRKATGLVRSGVYALATRGEESCS